MVFVSGGTFMMGGTIEEAISLCEAFVDNPTQICDPKGYEEMGFVSHRNTVTLKDFYIDEYEVSLDSYVNCVAADICDKASIEHELEAIQSGDSVPLDVPVIGISYYDAAVYCAWREARLPTESEWEYAARSKLSLVFPWGNDFDGKSANFCDETCDNSWANLEWNDGYWKLASIDALSTGRSWIGAYNLAGNAAEWTSTRLLQGIGAFRDVRITKGGSYLSPPYDLAGWMRLPTGADSGRSDLGFRCVRTTKP